jgi:hypothetical protein
MKKILATGLVTLGLITASACKSTSVPPETTASSNETVVPEPATISSANMAVPETEAPRLPTSLGASSSGLGH